MNPFGNEYAGIFLDKLSSVKNVPLYEYLVEFFGAVQGVSDPWDLDKFEKKLGSELLPGLDARELLGEEPLPVSGELCAMTWAAGCLIDAALMGGEYPGCPEAFSEAVARLKAESKKHPFLSRKPVYDMEYLKQECLDSLTWILLAEKETESAEDAVWESEEFTEQIEKLCDRLDPENAT